MNAKNIIQVVALTAVSLHSVAFAESVSIDSETLIRASLYNMPIQEIRKTPIKGLYEIQSNGAIYYTDPQGKHLINGHLFEVKTNKDITGERIADINRIKWNDLPLQDAIVHGPKNGLKMAVFTDPDCPYCKQLEKRLQNNTKIRSYTFLFPLVQIHPNAYAKSAAIWCAKNQHQAMLDVMLKNKVLSKASKGCKTPLNRNMKLAKKLGVSGTPTIFSEQGRKHTGGDLVTWLESQKEK